MDTNKTETGTTQEGLVCIQFGCGTNKLPHPWQNYDRDVDITKPLPFKSNTVDYILIEHCLEHVSGPQAFRFLREAHRILKPGGVIRVCVPELRNLNRDESEDIICNHGHLIVFNFQVLRQFLETALFIGVVPTERKEIDGHWKVIGFERDTKETLRVEAFKQH